MGSSSCVHRFRTRGLRQRSGMTEVLVLLAQPHRGCHIRPDLIVINRKPDDTGLESGSARIVSLAYSGRPSQNSRTVGSMKRRVPKKLIDLRFRIPTVRAVAKIKNFEPRASAEGQRLTRSSRPDQTAKPLEESHRQTRERTKRRTTAQTNDYGFRARSRRALPKRRKGRRA
jgi:hypothetical protein